jgi:hypothetical protein
MLDRILHWYRLLRRAVWPLIVIPIAIFGNLFAIRDEFLPAQLAAKLKMPEWLPAFPWYYWTILVLVLIVIAVLEGAFREHRDLTAQLAGDSVRLREVEAQEAHTEALRQQTAALEAQHRENSPLMKQFRSWQQNPKVLDLSVGTDHEYYDIPEYGLHGFTRRYKVKLQNISSHKTISNGKVQITAIEPPCGHRGPWLIAENITLSAGDQTFLPIASYGEAREQRRGPIDTVFKIESQSESSPLLGIKNEHVLTIRATAQDVRYCEIKCKLWVDESGGFQIAKL